MAKRKATRTPRTPAECPTGSTFAIRFRRCGSMTRNLRADGSEGSVTTRDLDGCEIIDWKPAKPQRDEGSVSGGIHG